MPIHIVGALAALCLLAPNIHARTTVVVTLSSVGERVRVQNPQLKSARLLIREAVGRARDGGRLDNPTWESSFEAGPALEERTLEIGFAQAFPVTNRLRLDKEISLLEIKAAEAEVADSERHLMASASQLAVELISSRERRELMRQQAGLYEDLVNSLQSAANKGEGSLLDAGQAQLEANQLTLELTRIAVEETTLGGQLKLLLGMLPGEELQVTGTLPDPSAPAPLQAVGDRPDYQAAMIRVEAAKREIELEQARRMDDVELGVFASMMRREDAPDGLKSDRMLGFKLSIPLPLWNRNQGAIDEAEARLQRRQVEAESLARSVRVQNETACDEMRRWRQWIGEINTRLMPLAEKQVSLADQGYRAGQAEIQILLRAREQQLELLIARLDALGKYHLARFQYPSAENSISTSSNNEN